MSLRIATWNIWWRFGEWEPRLAEIGATLESLDADIICLQEVWAELGGNHEAEILARRLGYEWVATKPVWESGADFGLEGIGMCNAILSRHPIGSTEEMILPNAPNAYAQRCVIQAAIATPNHRVNAFCTHFEWFYDASALRQRQATEVAKFVSRFTSESSEEFPPIVCGDLNAEPDSAEIRMLSGQQDVPVPGLVFNDSWVCSGNTEPGFTWVRENPYLHDTERPNRRLDYVFVGWPSLEGVGRVVSCSLFGDRPSGPYFGSDHFGVVATLEDDVQEA